MIKRFTFTCSVSRLVSSTLLSLACSISSIGFTSDQLASENDPGLDADNTSIATQKKQSIAPNREELLGKMRLVMGDTPAFDRGTIPKVEEISREQMPGYSRIKLRIEVEAGDWVTAWLLVPDQAKACPAMLCLHQTINIGKDEPVGLGQQESKRQALHLVQRGYVCLAPDYPSFGEYDYDLDEALASGKYASGTMKAIWNNLRCVDWLRTLPEVDANRMGVIGHSLGGHNALFTAAFDDRLKVAVSSCGFCSFHKYYGGNLKGWTSNKYMPRIATVYELSPSKVPFDFDDVLLAIYPRGVFAMSPLRDDNFNVTGVQDVMNNVEPVYAMNGIANMIKAVYPDAGHEWPEEQRDQAYAFIDNILKK